MGWARVAVAALAAPRACRPRSSLLALAREVRSHTMPRIAVIYYSVRRGARVRVESLRTPLPPASVRSLHLTPCSTLQTSAPPQLHGHVRKLAEVRAAAAACLRGAPPPPPAQPAAAACTSARLPLAGPP